MFGKWHNPGKNDYSLVLNVRFKKKNPCYLIIARVLRKGDPETVGNNVNKGIINISYNYQNLPVQIDKQVDTRLEYQYDATGNKLRQTEIYKGL